MKLSEDIIHEGTKLDDFAYGVGKYALVANNVGFASTLVGAGNAIICCDSPLKAAFFGALMACGVMQRSFMRDFAEESREYFRQKDAEASADPAGP
jgi:hypothetical protein